MPTVHFPTQVALLGSTSMPDTTIAHADDTGNTFIYIGEYGWLSFLPLGATYGGAVTTDDVTGAAQARKSAITPEGLITAAISGDTSEHTICQVTVPGGILGPNGHLRILVASVVFNNAGGPRTYSYSIYGHDTQSNEQTISTVQSPSLATGNYFASICDFDFINYGDEYINGLVGTMLTSGNPASGFSGIYADSISQIVDPGFASIYTQDDWTLRLAITMGSTSSLLSYAVPQITLTALYVP